MDRSAIISLTCVELLEGIIWVRVLRGTKAVVFVRRILRDQTSKVL